ncbi:MAG: GNAT family N-acetyltransferase [bacterium]
MPVLQTARLTLDRITADDAEFIRALLTEPSFLRYIGDRGVQTADDARRYIEEGPVASYAAHGFGLYLVRLTDGGTPIGMCGLLKREALQDVDVGFALRPAYWGNGYARESALAVMHHARDDFGLTRLAAIVSPDNKPSISVLEALGLRFEETRQLTADTEPVQVFGCDLGPAKDT